MELELISILIFFLVILQTIVGVGILVLGTPLFLILEFNIIEIMYYLLPISILTSFTNYLFLKYNKGKLQIFLDKNIKKNFIIFFLPGLSLGLFLAKEFIDIINFKLLVSLIIFLSIAVKWRYESIIQNLPLYLKKISFSLISVIHGLTNSGGTLLTVFFSTLNKNKKNQSRYSITFYYLILVAAQYFIFLFIFKEQLVFDYPLQFLIIILPALIIGNITSKKISENFFRKIIELLALFSGFFLLLNS
tara:strand:+ start:97 stop:840 length:744 start_codon:yes stop_codon:yes gene_type:complete